MSYSIFSISPFDKQLKQLSKKYPSLKLEFPTLVKSLVQQPQQGINLGNNCYKIRIAIGSKGRGKSGGARLITNIVISKNIVYLLSIYDKSDKENISDQELDNLIKLIPK